MSVEDARQQLNQIWATGTIGEDFKDAIDRLILEVRAEMPCSSYYVAELQADDCFDLGEYSEADKWPPREAFTPCPSCSARAELQKVAEAV